MLKFIFLINLLFMYNYLFLNDKFAIMVCLFIIVFSFLVLAKLLFNRLNNNLLSYNKASIYLLRL